MADSSFATWTFIAACVTALATVVGASAITAWFNLKAARLTAHAGHLREERTQLVGEVRNLLHQVSAFHACEDLMAKSIQQTQGGKMKAIKGEFRSRVESETGLPRPVMTRSQCRHA